MATMTYLNYSVILIWDGAECQKVLHVFQQKFKKIFCYKNVCSSLTEIMPRQISPSEKKVKRCKLSGL